MKIEIDSAEIGLLLEHHRTLVNLDMKAEQEAREATLKHRKEVLEQILGSSAPFLPMIVSSFFPSKSGGPLDSELKALITGLVRSVEIEQIEALSKIASNSQMAILVRIREIVEAMNPEPPSAVDPESPPPAG
jgi:hypothetical protein